MRCSCCYDPDILEMLQVDLVMLFFYLLLDILGVFLCKSALCSASRMGKGLVPSSYVDFVTICTEHRV